MHHNAGLLQKDVGTEKKVTGFCAPGAGLLNAVPVNTSSAGDCCILIAGTNDVSRGDQRAIYNYMEPVLRRLTVSSTVVITNLPTRHDLPAHSSVHRIVYAVNQFIAKLCGRLKGVELLDLSYIGRRHFTRHGLHLRMSGKRLLSRMIAEKLRSCSKPPCSGQLLEPTPADFTSAIPIRPKTLRFDSFADAVKTTSYEKTISTGQNTPLQKVQQTESTQTKVSIFLENHPTSNGFT